MLTLSFFAGSYYGTGAVFIIDMLGVEIKFGLCCQKFVLCNCYYAVENVIELVVITFRNINIVYLMIMCINQMTKLIFGLNV